jgi:cytochrome c oxidase subunit 2
MEKIIEISRQILGMPVVVSKHGPDVDKLVVYVHWLMAALFIGWLAYFLLALVKFNKKTNPKADYVGIKGHASSYIEAVVAIIEGVLLIGFAIPLWATAVDAFPKPDEHPTTMRVVAQQFAWNIFYPGVDGQFGDRSLELVNNDNPWGLDKNDAKGKDDFQTLNEMHVPVNKPVVIMLTSKDVIHSFKLIAMRVTQDAIPGVPIPLHFTPVVEGIYQINCAQLCGNGHSSMAGGRVIVETQEKFDKWFTAKSKGGGGATSLE